MSTYGKTSPELEKDISGTKLRCPKCKESYGLHHTNVGVMAREEDSDGTFVHVTTTPVVTVDTQPAREQYEGRRHHVRIDFNCEHCDEVGHLLIVQHKGVTFLEWDE